MKDKIIEKLENVLEFGGTKKDIVCLVISGIALLMSIFKVVDFETSWVAIVLCGLPIVLEAIIGLVKSFDIKADVLVAIALISSICIGEIFAGGEVAFIMQLGGLLEELTVSKARDGIEKLVNLTPQTARVITNGTEKIVKAEEVKVGDILRVLSGESVPVDGIVTKGETSINQAVMTGEPIPVDKSVGDEVSSGTVNQFGVFEMKATKVGEDSSIQRMIKLVQSANTDKVKIVNLADRWATWIVVGALTSALITWLITGEIIRAVTILVVFCPCSLVLATPTSVMASIGNATKHGFLVREGDALERLSKVSKIAFDKTGTLTYGTPKVTKVRSIVERYSNDELFKIVASVEKLSEHPLGKAIVSSYSKELFLVDSFKMYTGKGVSAILNGSTILVGNQKLIEEHQIAINSSLTKEVEEYLLQGGTVIFVSIDSVLCGYVVLSDTVREETSNMISSIINLGIAPVLLTGDNKNSANTIAKKVGINEIHANCLPEDKLNCIKQYQSKGQAICMVGDGINDAPSLKVSNVGIAMGGIGSDIAIDSSDIAMVNDDIKELPHILALSKHMMFIIKCNLTFSLLLNFVAIILAMTGILNPVVGALVHNTGSVIVIINSALLLKWRAKE